MSVVGALPQAGLIEDGALQAANKQLIAIVDAGNALRDLVMNPSNADSPVSHVVNKARLVAAQMLLDLEKAVA